MYNILKSEEKFCSEESLRVGLVQEGLKNCCRTKTYSLQTNIIEDKMSIELIIGGRYEYEKMLLSEFDHLSVNPSCKKFSSTITLEELGPDLSHKFESLKNLQVFLSDPNNLRVNHETGTIEFIMSLSLLNGKFLTHTFGELFLTLEKTDEPIKEEEEIETILNMCELGLWNETVNHEIAKVFKVFSRMFRILMRKMENDKPEDENRSINILQTKSNRKGNESMNKSKKKNSSNNLIDEQTNSLNVEKTNKSFSLSNIQFNNVKNGVCGVGNALNNSPLGNSPKVHVKNPPEIDILSNFSKGNDNEQSNTVSMFENFKKDILKEFKMFKEEVNRDRNNGLVNIITGIKSMPHAQIINSLDEKYFTNFLKMEDRVKLLDQELKKTNKMLESIFEKMEKFSKNQSKFEEKFSDIVDSIDLLSSTKIIENSVYEVRHEILDTSALFFSSQFELKGLNISYTGEDSQSTMLFSKQQISNSHQTFSIRIIKSLVNNIQIGLADQEYRDLQDSWELPNFILYVGWSSTVYEGPSNLLLKQGDGFKEGDIITVKACLDTGIVEWYVGREVKARVQWQKLKNETIKWVPVIRFFDHGDTIGWMTESMWKL